MTRAPRRNTRQLVERPVAALGAAVQRFPALVVVAVVATTLALLVLPGLAPPAPDDGTVELDVPEILAAETIAERFGEPGQEVVIVLMRSDSGSLVGVDGYAAAEAIESAIHTSDVGSELVDDEGHSGVLSWILPARLALDGTSTAALSNEDVVAAYEAAIDELPDDQARFIARLLPSDRAATDADSALLMVVLDTSDLPDDPTGYGDAMVERAQTVADAAGATLLPDGISATPYSPYIAVDGDAMGAEIGTLFAGAFVIIMVILLLVYWIRPNLGMTRRRSARRSAADMLPAWPPSSWPSCG